MSTMRITPVALETRILRPSEVSRLVAKPQLYMRAQWLVLPPDVAARTMIHDVAVGHMSQFASSGRYPGFLFSGVFTDPWDAPRLEALKKKAGFTPSEIDAADRGVRYSAGVKEFLEAGIRIPIVQLMGDTCSPHHQIVVTIENSSGESILGCGAIVGETLNPLTVSKATESYPEKECYNCSSSVPYDQVLCDRCSSISD